MGGNVKNLNSDQKDYLRNIQKLLKQATGFCEGASIDTIAETQFPDKKSAIEYFNSHNRAFTERITELINQADELLDGALEDN